MDQMATEIKETLPKVYTKELVEILFRLPYTKRQFLIDAKLGTPKIVGNYLMELENSGFLISEKVGKEKLYLNYKLMNIGNPLIFLGCKFLKKGMKEYLIIS